MQAAGINIAYHFAHYKYRVNVVDLTNERLGRAIDHSIRQVKGARYDQAKCLLTTQLGGVVSSYLFQNGGTLTPEFRCDAVVVVFINRARDFDHVITAIERVKRTIFPTNKIFVVEEVASSSDGHWWVKKSWLKVQYHHAKMKLREIDVKKLVSMISEIVLIGWDANQSKSDEFGKN